MMMRAETRDNIRIGAVNYLNSKPLIEGLAGFAPQAELVLDYPSRLADGLLSGAYDVALVPSIACLLEPDYEVVSDACVAARGPVLSVKLYSRVPPENIRRLALDAGSRTSATLTRILLAERYGISPEIERLPLELDTTNTNADAVLLIGDRAIDPPREQFSVTWDLGEEWHRWTGLPFVFAMWATRAGADLGPVEAALYQARDEGIRNIAAIARREAPLLGLDERVTLDYLTKNLYYRLGKAEQQGLRRFHELAVRHELAPGGIDLVFRHYATA
jgi:chorismate dehydratase